MPKHSTVFYTTCFQNKAPPSPVPYYSCILNYTTVRIVASTGTLTSRARIWGRLYGWAIQVERSRSNRRRHRPSSRPCSNRPRQLRRESATFRDCSSRNMILGSNKKWPQSESLITHARGAAACAGMLPSRDLPDLGIVLPIGNSELNHQTFAMTISQWRSPQNHTEFAQACLGDSASPY
eukprot:COSAG02_NODE_16843_length_1051_cov_1.946429_1_plen_180_part_00